MAELFFFPKAPLRARGKEHLFLFFFPNPRRHGLVSFSTFPNSAASSFFSQRDFLLGIFLQKGALFLLLLASQPFPALLPFVSFSPPIEIAALFSRLHDILFFLEGEAALLSLPTP